MSLQRLSAIACATLGLSGAALALQSVTLERFVVTGADVTFARGIDSQGSVAGSYTLPDGSSHGYLRDASGTLQLVDWPGGTTTFFEGITPGGIAVGFAVGPGSIGPVEYDGGVWTALTPPPQAGVFLQGGNDSGLRVGNLVGAFGSRHGVLFTGGVPTLLDYPGAHSTELEDINELGIIVGNYRPDAVGIWHGFVHNLNSGTFRTLDHPDGAETRLRGINDFDTIVGDTLLSGASNRRAVVFEGGEWSDLELFGVFGDSRASGVSNDGHICGEYYGQFAGAAAVLGFVFDPNGFGPSRYCEATPNSSGAPADIHYVGTTSLAANDLVLEAGPAPANTSGLFFYGPGAVQRPFGDGYLCVSGPHHRLAVGSTDAAGYALHAFDANAASGALAAGSRWYFQYWFRDTAAGGAGNNTSRGLAVDFTP